MKLFSHIFFVLLLILFAVGTTVQAARSTSMEIAIAGSINTNMADCDDCSGDDGTSSCGSFCAVPLSVDLDSVTLTHPARPGTSFYSLAEDGDSTVGPPDPYPPRSFIMN